MDAGLSAPKGQDIDAIIDLHKAFRLHMENYPQPSV